MALDALLFQKINNLVGESAWLDSAAIFLAHCLPLVLGGAVFLFLLYNFQKYWWMFLEILVAGVVSFFSTQIIGLLFYRARPFLLAGVKNILEHSSDPSFPSSHATALFALSAIVGLYNKKAGILFLISAGLVSFARVFCAVHWPSDVLFGMFLGIWVGIIVHFVPRKIFKLG